MGEIKCIQITANTSPGPYSSSVMKETYYVFAPSLSGPITQAEEEQNSEETPYALIISLTLKR